jgi:hypothetical protein
VHALPQGCNGKAEDGNFEIVNRSENPGVTG